MDRSNEHLRLIDAHPAVDLGGDPDVSIAARTGAYVLISGGDERVRERVARFVHHASAQRDEPFAVLDLESADENPARASRGCFYVKNVQDLDANSQARLLSLVREWSLSRVRVRLMAGASADLVERVNSGRFSDDLFYSLNEIHIVIPRAAAGHQTRKPRPSLRAWSANGLHRLSERFRRNVAL